MSSFTGVSIIADGKLSSTLAIDAGRDSGYHLLMVKDYSRAVREMPNGESISTGPFMVGGHKWCIRYYPNGSDPSSADFISLSLIHVERSAKNNCNCGGMLGLQYVFSFVDQVQYQKPMHIRATETYSFCCCKDNCNCGGTMDFMRRDDLERSAHLKGDCFTIRCDIMVCKDLIAKQKKPWRM